LSYIYHKYEGFFLIENNRAVARAMQQVRIYSQSSYILEQARKSWISLGIPAKFLVKFLFFFDYVSVNNQEHKGKEQKTTLP
jgi:hypothetical protein